MNSPVSPSVVSPPNSVTPSAGVGDKTPTPITPSKAALAKEKLEKPSGLSRVFNPPKLERKHSSGDLISRLKTRKILGVGETDNGDIHRSKISQVLGHNEHLYVRLPRGYWITHVFLGVEITLEALLLLFAPALAIYFGLFPSTVAEEGYPTHAIRVSGAALFGLVVFLWALVGTTDKHYARTVLMALFTYHAISFTLLIGIALNQGNIGDLGIGMSIAVRALLCLVCIAYFHSIGEPGSGVRKSSSYREITKDEGKAEAKQSNKVPDEITPDSEDKKEK